MAGKKGSKTDARTPTRTNGASDRSILDQARAITATGRSVLGLPSGLEPMALAPPEPSHAIQEQNLKAALEASSIFVETLESDGALAVEEIEREVAFLSPYIQREVLHHGRGFTSEAPIALPSKVTPEVLQLLLQYCRFHRASGRSDKERKMFDEKFVRLDTRRLCELTSAADALDMKPLVDLTSRALARLIEGKTPEQIRAQFQLPDDLTEEEKLEPVRNFGDDPKIRLLNRLYEKKRKELQRRREEEENLKKGDSILALEGGPPAGGSPQPDARSLDDLLSFIDGSADKGASKGTKKKRGKGGRKQPQVPPPLSNGHRASAGSNGKGDPPKHWSGESAGGTSYEEGGEEEEGTLDDIDEEDEGEGEAAGGSWQVQQEELLMHSASFGPILGPITTLTSLANFKARSLPTPRDAATGEAAPGPDSAAGRSQALSVSKDAQSSKAPSDELQASAKAELGRQEAALQLRFGTKGLPSGNSACGCTNRCGNAKNSVRHKAWGNPGDVAAAQHAMLAFLERCGLSRQLTLVPVEQLPPDQATEDCSATVHRGDGDVIQDVVLPNGSTLHLSLTRAAR
ncbi:hypothetical protein WJX75_000514 [Coccomyxa subellipsoidea]|uniref:SKP1 component dimerisation domain-containing protein n=1 Tax=Coccomyxa subellipsoidea TaxID=248742 RepID=A0ABR2YTT5_9CHLO